MEVYTPHRHPTDAEERLLKTVKDAGAALVLGEVTGFRVGWLLGYRMASGTMPDAGISGFGETYYCDVAATMIDDSLTRELIDALIEDGILKGYRKPRHPEGGAQGRC